MVHRLHTISLCEACALAAFTLTIASITAVDFFTGFVQQTTLLLRLLCQKLLPLSSAFVFLSRWLVFFQSLVDGFFGDRVQISANLHFVGIGGVRSPNRTHCQPNIVCCYVRFKHARCVHAFVCVCVCSCLYVYVKRVRIWHSSTWFHPCSGRCKCKLKWIIIAFVNNKVTNPLTALTTEQSIWIFCTRRISTLLLLII